MRVRQFIKKLNNTELGKSGAHETYVLVPQNVDLQDMFNDISNTLRFYDKISKKYIENIRYTKPGKEIRIVGLGPYYRDNDVNAGDEIIFERIDNNNNETKFYIDLSLKKDLIVFQKKGTNGFEALNIERLQPKLTDNEYIIITNIDGIDKPLKIKHIGSFKKREDSPEKTDFYDLFVNSKSIKEDYKNNALVELQVSKNGNYLRQTSVWQKHEFKW